MSRTSSLISRFLEPMMKRAAANAARCESILRELSDLEYEYESAFEDHDSDIDDEAQYANYTKKQAFKPGRLCMFGSPEWARYDAIPDSAAPEPACSYHWRQVEVLRAEWYKRAERYQARITALQNEWAAIAV